MAGMQPVHFFTLHVKAIANLVQIIEDFVPEEEIDTGDQHSTVSAS